MVIRAMVAPVVMVFVLCTPFSNSIKQLQIVLFAEV